MSKSVSLQSEGPTHISCEQPRRRYSRISQGQLLQGQSQPGSAGYETHSNQLRNKGSYQLRSLVSIKTVCQSRSHQKQVTHSSQDNLRRAYVQKINLVHNYYVQKYGCDLGKPQGKSIKPRTGSNGAQSSKGEGYWNSEKRVVENRPP